MGYMKCSVGIVLLMCYHDSIAKPHTTNDLGCLGQSCTIREKKKINRMQYLK